MASNTNIAMALTQGQDATQYTQANISGSNIGVGSVVIQGGGQNVSGQSQSLIGVGGAGSGNTLGQSYNVNPYTYYSPINITTAHGDKAIESATQIAKAQQAAQSALPGTAGMTSQIWYWVAAGVLIILFLRRHH